MEKVKQFLMYFSLFLIGMILLSITSIAIVYTINVLGEVAGLVLLSFITAVFGAGLIVLLD